MAASYFSLPKTIHRNLKLNALASTNNFPSLSSSIFISTSKWLPQYRSRQLSHVSSSSATHKKVFRVSALAQDTEYSTDTLSSEVNIQAGERPEDAGAEQNTEGETTATVAKGVELYVGNLPRSCDSAQLTHIFGEFGTVDSVEVKCNAETGISRGFAHVTMSNEEEALDAIVKLQNYDLGGRDIIVNFPGRVRYTRGGWKVYVGNIAWSVKRGYLKRLFSQFGNVLGLRMYYDRQNGASRAYCFVFLSTRTEVEGAVAALNGKEMHGRKLVVREAEPYKKNIRESDEDRGMLIGSKYVHDILVKPASAQIDNRSDRSRMFLPKTPYRVYVGNLSRSANAKSLEELFGQCGNVVDARVLYQRKQGIPRVFGFVYYSSQTEVDSAVAALNGKEFIGRTLLVQKAKEKNLAGLSEQNHKDQNGGT